jgi:hypothetical protein
VSRYAAGMRMLAALLVVALSSTAGAAQPLDQTAAKELIERWLKAQNTQDFAS